MNHPQLQEETSGSRTFHTPQQTARNKTVVKNFWRCTAKAFRNKIAASNVAQEAVHLHMQHKRYVRETGNHLTAHNFLGSDVLYTPESLVTKRYHKGIAPVKKHLTKKQLAASNKTAPELPVKKHLIKKHMKRGRPDPAVDFPRLNRHGVCVSVSKVIEDDFMGIPFHLQGDASMESAYLEGVRCFQRAMTPLVQSQGTEGVSVDWLFDQIEKMVALSHWWKKCHTSADLLQWVSLAYRVFTTRNATTDALSYMVGKYNDLQGDMLEDFVSVLRSGFDKCESVRSSELVERAGKVYTFLMVQGFLTRFGIDLPSSGYTKLEAKALAMTHSSKSGLWFTVFDNTIFVLERICAYRKTGEVSSFLHSGGEYVQWLDKTDKLLALAPFTSNLVPHGTTYFKFVSDLNHAIEQGDSYARFTKKNSGAESLLMRKKLQALHLLKNTEVTKRASQQERRAPFGVLVHGGSSVGKSTFTKMLYYYYGRVHGLDTDDHFRYVRSPSDEYWSNFDTSMWCIQMDDIAYLLPKKATTVDPTLSELLNVVNNVPHVPPQADLADKGKTPIRAKLVIATSNAGNLNADEYFWCPLAVRRRLPFVVKVEPKDEYKHENGRFLDPAKLPPLAGDFPDYWRLTLQKVKPVIQSEREQADLQTIGIYDNVHEFLKVFAEESKKHEEVQDKSMTCDVGMRDLKVCPVCLYGMNHCACETQGAASGVAVWLMAVMWSVLVSFFELRYVVSTALYLAQWQAFRRLYIERVVACLPAREQMRRLGVLNMGETRDKRFVQVLAILAGVAGLGLVMHSMRRQCKSEPAPERVMEESDDEDDYRYDYYDACRTLDSMQSDIELQQERVQELAIKRGNKPLADVVAVEQKTLSAQGNVFGTTEAQLKKEERQNVWYSKDLTLSRFDMPIAATSLVGATADELRDLFGRNCVRVHITGVDEPWSMKIGAVFVRGQFCLINNHAFAKASKWRITMIQASTAPGVSGNIDLMLDERDLKRDPSKDICVFEVRCVPPFKDITKFWTQRNVQATSGVVLRRDVDGMCEKQHVYGLNLLENVLVESLDRRMDIYMGTGDRTTRAGDCGGILLSTTPQGVSVLGIHTLGHADRCGFTALPLGPVNDLIVKFARIEVQGGGAPSFETPTVKRSLEAAHWRSLFRYIPQGTANVYGTFTGFRPKPKSKVCNTPLASDMCEHFGYTIRYGPPVMGGWEPWRKNVVEMVKPQVVYDQTLLRFCVDSYVEDIISHLPKEWESQLMFLSTKAAVNGLPGVIFIDGLNRKTSMGFPWNKSKKSFLVDDMSEEYPDGVAFTEEVNVRAQKIRECYDQGRRAYPVYTGHLKDEPRPEEKIASASTRLFTASPVDQSVVMREKLLSFVRLLQLNKFAFEAAPGTVCQSTEWGEFRKYLTRFGDHKIVGGDYGKYDKRMTADFVLAAFDVICQIHKRAGFSEEEVRSIMCIGHDVAFPLVNVNGDLVEFFGTNPSGHPLTVVINSLVNSLYMRYCFYKMRPEGSKDTFKENVALITYGDDNGMGVSDRVPWFNHTTIQSALSDIGVEYTMADKVSASVPYIHIDQFSFLKRRWVYDEHVGAWLCPLEEESIHKSLTTWTPSQSVDCYKQMVDVISSANSEYFFYGKEVFQKHHDYFARVLSEGPYRAYVTDKTLPSWESLRERFWRASRDVSHSD